MLCCWRSKAPLSFPVRWWGASSSTQATRATHDETPTTQRRTQSVHAHVLALWPNIRRAHDSHPSHIHKTTSVSNTRDKSVPERRWWGRGEHGAATTFLGLCVSVGRRVAWASAGSVVYCVPLYWELFRIVFRLRQQYRIATPPTSKDTSLYLHPLTIIRNTHMSQIQRAFFFAWCGPLVSEKPPACVVCVSAVRTASSSSEYSSIQLSIN